MSGQDSSPSTLKDKTQAFLAEFFVKGEELVRELILENERLRVAATTGPEEPTVSPSAPETVVEQLMARVNRLESECTEIRRIAGNVKQESGGYRDRLDLLEREHYNLAAMYVAGNQFHSATTIEDVVRTITEILLNFVGVGHFTIFCVDEERQFLFPLASEGGDVADYQEITLASDGPFAEVVRKRGPWRTGDPMISLDGALLFLPLVSGTRLVGATRIDSFLPQKHEFTENDHSLLELISEHSGIGIETAWIRAHAQEMPLRRQTVEDLVRA